MIPLLPVDFNARDAEGNVLAVIFLGEHVAVIDEEGNRAEGEVVGVRGNVIQITVAWDTWIPHDA